MSLLIDQIKGDVIPTVMHHLFYFPVLTDGTILRSWLKTPSILLILWGLVTKNKQMVKKGHLSFRKGLFGILLEGFVAPCRYLLRGGFSIHSSGLIIWWVAICVISAINAKSIWSFFSLVFSLFKLLYVLLFGDTNVGEVFSPFDEYTSVVLLVFMIVAGLFGLGHYFVARFMHLSKSTPNGINWLIFFFEEDLYAWKSYIYTIVEPAILAAIAYGLYGLDTAACVYFSICAAFTFIVNGLNTLHRARVSHF